MVPSSYQTKDRGQEYFVNQVRRMAVPGTRGWLNILQSPRIDTAIDKDAIDTDQSTWSDIASLRFVAQHGGAVNARWTGNIDDTSSDSIVYIVFCLSDAAGNKFCTHLSGDPTKNVLIRSGRITPAGIPLPASWEEAFGANIRGRELSPGSPYRISVKGYHSVALAADTAVLGSSIILTGNIEGG